MKKRKLKLDLNKLAVETFEATGEEKTRGTIQGWDGTTTIATTYGPWFCPDDCGGGTPIP